VARAALAGLPQAAAQLLGHYSCVVVGASKPGTTAAKPLRTLERERVAIETVFCERDDEGDRLVWVMIQGDGGALIHDSPFEIDREHAASRSAARCPTGRRPNRNCS